MAKKQRLDKAIAMQGALSRSEVKTLIESLGGKVTGSVTSKTDYLINNDVESTSSKNKKARELGIPILSEEEFLEMTQGEGQ